MKLAIKEIIKAVKGQLFGEISLTNQVTSVEFDTRKVVSGTLFVPLKGNRDGHDFIDVAFENGAVLTLSDRQLENKPYILVEDTQKALQDLAKYYLAKVAPKVVGITGSNGKTTTKDMTAAVLSKSFKTYKTQGNYNNEIGLPYTILSMDLDTEVAVLEMGMDRKGDIELLSQIGRPDVAAITIIGESHIEYLGSRQGIAEAKMEIVTGLKDNGTLIVPSNEPLLKPILEKVTQEKVLFGLEDSAAVKADIVSESKNETTFTTTLFPKVVFSIPVLGQYNVNNALIAISVGNILGVPVEKIKTGLANFDLTKNRTEWIQTPKGMDILSDVYNANPTAMNLVLDSFSKVETKGRKIVVLGDMLELGKSSKEMHESVAKHLSPEEIDAVYLYGTEMRYLFEKLTNQFSENNISLFEKENKENLIKALSNEINPTDTIFLKGSNGMGLKEIVEYLLNNH
ncbi:UDP-N-acetylmuramoyl-tripeptide--D-alanyl-D-alanine ligase [Vagococcus fluvialis]|uniref:UDP-N-acetylmuramoyl-tripeptide--D-alanyl-D-alanine ligase n=1 Tax=Vagococcus fluvialis TaxID=2738 RepID=A0A7X6I1U6_9ENTE|nr:UDP-N-acetylmuramoyl-tripeptide--D-alanyl-D-alanine ligase [Vagococcus fluvialis]NKC66475.1 UDP-N-acetylmuramoyl-tripeptide--D-alanyl-D-alanine ligase [Vagococcus fluvialis]